MKVGVSRFERDFNVQEIHFWKEKPTDFELLNCIVSIFRCYKWPYENCLEDNIMEMMKQTYQKKDLLEVVHIIMVILKWWAQKDHFNLMDH